MCTKLHRTISKSRTTNLLRHNTVLPKNIDGYSVSGQQDSTRVYEHKLRERHKITVLTLLCSIHILQTIGQKKTNAEWGSRTLRQACYRENPESAMCVQNFNDSRGLAIRITYRISLRSSSLWEPRHPPLKVVLDYSFEF